LLKSGTLEDLLE